MPQIHIASTTESLGVKSAGTMNAQQFLADAVARDAKQRHTLTKDPSIADLIIFAESHKNPPPGTPNASERVAAHPLYAKFRERCVIHNGSDRPDPRVPGLYPSLPRRWADALGSVGAPYLAELNPYIEGMVNDRSQPQMLASFMGSCAHKPLRQRLCQLAKRPGWDGIVFEDSTNAFVGSLRQRDEQAHAELKRAFVQQILDTRFVLCPEGAGPSSYRIYESMQCARSPVIIGSNWLPPPGPDWDRFAVRIASNQIHKLPEILADHRDQWEQMGNLARSAWEQHYHPDTFGNEIVRLAQIVLDKKPHARLSRKLAAQIFNLGPANLNRIQARINRHRG